MTARNWLVAIVAVVAAALFAFATISPRQTLTPDNAAYVAMASGKPAQAPFCFRVLVPFVAGLLPLPAPAALRLITCVCLAGVYLCGLYLCNIEGANIAASMSALLLLYCSRPNLFNYYNPYLTDAAGWLIIFVLCIAFLKGWYPCFIAVATIGALVRESALFPCAAWLLNQRTRRLVGFLLIPGIMFLLPRILVHAQQGYGDYLVSSTTARTSFSAKEVLYGLFMSWGALWILAFYGITRCSKELWAVAAALACGAVAGSIVITAGDYERMLGVLAPVILVASGKTLRVARRVSPLGFGVILCCAPLQFLFGSPHVLLAEGHAYRVGLVLSTSLTTCVAIGLVVLLHRSQIRQCGDRTEHGRKTPDAVEQ
jgi:hypothetical protein